MKKYYAILFGLFVLITSTHAQYVTIPDAFFRNFLKNKYPACFNAANMMDTTCSSIVNEDSLVFTNYGLSSLDGAQYFKSLVFLVCSNDNLSSLPALPTSLIYLDCFGNRLTNLQTLPDSLIYLNCWGNKLASLPSLPGSLDYLDCGYNQLTMLPALPNLLDHLNCGYNQLTILPTLPNSLNELDCYGNKLANLPALPGSLRHVSCYRNSLDSLPSLPNSLIYLNCIENQLMSLPQLPDSLKELRCTDNPLDCLPKLPYNLLKIDIDTFYSIKTNIQCIPNIFIGYNSTLQQKFPLCDSANNTNHCISFPTYTFTGNGNWSNVINWSNNSIPPSNVQIDSQIIIDPLESGECILDIHQTISSGSLLIVQKGKKFTINGNLIIQ